MASKPQQILQLNPASEILFEGPFDKVVTSFLEISNPSQEKVAFKVKTTAPRRYCVRPNSGIVTPGSKMRIAIMLQPIEQESQVERSKHKFMVQSVVVSQEDCSFDEVWKVVYQEDIMDSKLRCIFHTPTQGSQDTDQSATENASQRPTPTKTTTSTIAPEVQRMGEEVHNKTAPDIVQTNNQKSTASPAGIATRSGSSGSGSSSSESQLENKTNEPASSAQIKPQEQPITSKPSRPPRYSGGFLREQRNLINRSELRSSDKSIASSQDLTSSFLQPMSNDHKLVLVCLITLILGVILGKYII